MLPAAKPFTANAISSCVSVPPSRFLAMISYMRIKNLLYPFCVRAGQPTRTLLQPERKGADGRPAYRPAAAARP